MRQPRYPIFTIDREGWMSMVGGPEELPYLHEQFDIEEGEYSGWDVDGYPIALVWRADSGPSASVCLDIAQPDELRTAILHYARLGSPNLPLDPYYSIKDNVQLFEAVSRHVEDSHPTLAQRIRRFLRH